MCLLLRYVCIAMEAMEQLLLACHCQSINLLVESFLSTLRLLLEADKPHLHILATSSVSSIRAGLSQGRGPALNHTAVKEASPRVHCSTPSVFLNTKSF